MGIVNTVIVNKDCTYQCYILEKYEKSTQTF